MHAPSSVRAGFIGSLAPGSDLDLRGTTIDGMLLRDVLTACQDPGTGAPRVGSAGFREVTFTNGADFRSVAFGGYADFRWARFSGTAEFSSAAFTQGVQFYSATFNRDVDFYAATFTDEADFREVTFARDATFVSATFTGNAGFREATFSRTADFRDVTFSGDADFHAAAFNRTAFFTSATFARDAYFTSAPFFGTAYFGSTTFGRAAHLGSATFAGDLVFDGAVFEGLQHLGPLSCRGEMRFDGARLAGAQVTIEAAAKAVSFERAVFEQSVALRLRYAAVNLSRATLAAPAALSAWPVPFAAADGVAVGEELLANYGGGAGVWLLSLEGVDAGQLVLTDVHLDVCQFTGAFHLDQIRIGFGCHFAGPPVGWHLRGILPARWSARKVLAEEQYWRAEAGGRAADGWSAGPHRGTPRAAGADDLVGVYQQLRKAFEEAGNEPDAADFYYGEMEMRRHDAQRPRAERRLLWLYWLASGYGLRASRAVSLLLVAMIMTFGLMLLFGLPDDTPDPQTKGTYGGGVVATTTKTPDPVLSLPWSRRITADRAEKAALVVVNSVVFRSSGQNLTLPGTVLEMASRIGEPVLLGLAALAVRSRVKR